MNINQILDNPQLLDTLTDPQKLQVYQDLIKYEQQLNQQRIQTQTTLELKQKEQQDLLTQLQQLTGKQTIEDIRNYITTLQQQFTTDLTTITNEYSQIHKELN